MADFTTSLDALKRLITDCEETIRDTYTPEVVTTLLIDVVGCLEAYQNDMKQDQTSPESCSQCGAAEHNLRANKSEAEVERLNSVIIAAAGYLEMDDPELASPGAVAARLRAALPPKGLCPGGCGMPPHVCVCDGGDRDIAPGRSCASCALGCGFRPCLRTECSGPAGRPESHDLWTLKRPTTEDEGTGQ